MHHIYFVLLLLGAGLLDGVLAYTNPERIAAMKKSGSYDKCMTDCANFRVKTHTGKNDIKEKSQKKCQSGCKEIYGGGGGGGGGDGGGGKKDKKGGK